MDDGQRLAKVETEVDSLRENLREIKAEQIRGRDQIEKLRVHMDEELSRTRDRMEQQFAEARDYTDRKFSEARAHTDQGLSEIRASLEDIRKEQTKTTRWLVSLTITYGTAILSMMAKMAGIL